MKARPEIGEFFTNLATIAEVGYYSERMDGFAAAMIVTYQNATRRPEQIQGHVGELKERGVFMVKCTNKRPISGYERDSILHTFEHAADGRIIKWFCTASNDPDVLMNELIAIKATVKKHDTWHGQDQTLVNRVKWLKDDHDQAA